MALIDPIDAESTYNESGWAARRKEAREWRALLGGIPGSAGAAIRRKYLRVKKWVLLKVIYAQHQRVVR